MPESSLQEADRSVVPLLTPSGDSSALTIQPASYAQSPARQWAILALGFTAITLARIALSSALHDRVAYSVYFIAVALGAWLGGWRMGLFATALAAFLTKFLPLPTGHEVSLARPGDLAAFILFCGVSGCIVASLEALQRAKAVSDRHASAADQHAQILEREIALRIEAERELRQKSEELQAMMNAIPVPVLVAHDRGCIDVVGNRAANVLCDSHGLPAADAFGRLDCPMAHFDAEGNELTAEDHPLQRAAVSGRPTEVSDLLLRLSDGRNLWFSAAATPLLDESGVARGAVAAYADITARKRAEEAQREQEATLRLHVDQIEALNTRLRRAMAETHHRVKNNLQVVSALVDIQTLSYDDAVPREELVRIARHIRSLAAIHDLLTVKARSESDVRRVRAQEVVDKLAPLLQSIAPDRKLRFEGQDAELGLPQGTSLAVLINELVSNALKHGRGDIEVHFALREEKMSLTVSDQGPGFAADFDPVQMMNTGLELIESVARYDLMGTVTYSNGPNGGAVVRVEFRRPTG